MKNFKKIYVLGAGAVGCFFGGMLARAHHDVTLVGRSDRALAIQDHGLAMECQTFNETIPIKARRVVTFHASQKLKEQIQGIPAEVSE